MLSPIYDPSDVIKQMVYDTLKSVIDPELNINIIDLGLVYHIELKDENIIFIEMTLSSEGCPMGDVIMEEMESVIAKEFPEHKLALQLVWEPKWSSEFITLAGLKQLNFG